LPAVEPSHFRQVIRLSHQASDQHWEFIWRTELLRMLEIGILVFSYVTLESASYCRCNA
jgi:hypothetical protein